MKRKIFLLVVTAVFGFVAVSYAAQVGDTGKALWQGKDYDVKVVKVSKDGARCFITWPGYSKSWDEWRNCSEIKQIKTTKTEAIPSASYAVGDAVKVQWKGSWYDASVISVNNKKGTYKIHYDGYNDSWDEWVTDNRIKKK